MECLQSLGDKYVYDIVGHSGTLSFTLNVVYSPSPLSPVSQTTSGDSECIEFVPPGKPPKDEMERLKVLQTMSAHSQYCFSGDTTLKATERAVKDIVKDDAGEFFHLSFFGLCKILVFHC